MMVEGVVCVSQPPDGCFIRVRESVHVAYLAIV